VLNLLNSLLEGLLADRELHKKRSCFRWAKQLLPNDAGRGKEFGWESDGLSDGFPPFATPKWP
jgi:hypothetical protein